MVDNSKIGKAAAASGRPVKIIHVYTRNGVGSLGDKVLVTIEHEMKRGYIVGCRQKQKANVARIDSNNIVLIDEQGLPLGTRIKAPIPSACRRHASPELLKVLALAPRFV